MNFLPQAIGPKNLTKDQFVKCFILRYGTGFVGLAKNFWGEVTMTSSLHVLSFRMWLYFRLTYSVTGGFQTLSYLKDDS